MRDPEFVSIGNLQSEWNSSLYRLINLINLHAMMLAFSTSSVKRGDAMNILLESVILSRLTT